VLELSADRPAEHDRLDAARVSLGLLGVFSSLRLQLVPAYRLHERTWRTGIDECLAELDADVAARRHYEFWWFPHRDFADRKALALTDAEPDSVAGREGERIDWSYRILPSVRELKFNEMEYSVPAEAGPACFRAVRERMKSRWPDVVWPVEYRTLAADSGWLSTAHQRATVAISLHQDARLPCDAFFSDCEAVFARTRAGRTGPSCTGARARSWPRCIQVGGVPRAASELDPAGTFANAHLRELFGPL
jgi:hypothetical protein